MITFRIKDSRTCVFVLRNGSMFGIIHKIDEKWMYMDRQMGSKGTLLENHLWKIKRRIKALYRDQPPI